MSLITLSFFFLWSLSISGASINIKRSERFDASLHYENGVVKKNQNYRVEGKIINKETGEAIPYCSITIADTYTGTSSNEQGEFIINVDTVPVKIVVSHINFEKQEITISNYANVVIELLPLANSLDEVVLSSKKGRDLYALELATKAFERIKSMSKKRNYGKAFYRQKSKNGEDYSELAEIIYDISYTSSGIKDWDIIEGRYALKQGSVNNKNYTLFSSILKSFQPDTDDLFFPLNSNLEKLYDIKIIDILTSEQSKIAVLKFKALKYFKEMPMLDGEVYINTVTHDVLKVTGTISKDDLKFVKFTKNNATKKKYTLSYEMAFKKDSTLQLALDYIKIDNEFDYYKSDIFQTHVSSTSSLTFFEYYTPTSRKKLGRRFKGNQSDWQKLNEIGYNQKFWKDNSIVKRTPIEKEVIASFEKDNAFESIFINSRGQIALTQSRILDDVFVNKLDQSLLQYNSNNPVEKVFIHTDKDIFSAGEDLWFSSYTVLGQFHHYSLASKVLHVDLISPNNKIVVSQTRELIKGRGNGTIELPSDLTSGIYRLRAYTNWMRNFDDSLFFSKTIKILNKETTKTKKVVINDKIDLQFFPESGNAVAGINGKIAFKSIGLDGLGKPIKGKIINSKGAHVLNFNTLDYGMGFFNIIPELNETYTAVLQDNSKYPLPEILNNGYSLTVDNTGSKSIKVKIQASKNLRSQSFYIIGLLKNEKYYQGKFDFGGKYIVEFEIPKTRLPSGIMTLTLFDEQNKPWNERLLFVNNQEELVINTKLSNSKFKSRDKIILNVNITDTDGKPVSTDLSIAVTDLDQTKKATYTNNILTHLLLQSDIKGHIENPGYYFKDNTQPTKSRLDLVMLTQGWRRFNWEALEVDNPQVNKFAFEDGYSISGTLKSVSNTPLKHTNLKMIANSKDKTALYTAKTDAKGHFVIPQVNHSDSIQLFFNAFNNNKLIRNTSVAIEVSKSPEPSMALPQSNYYRPEKIIKTKEETAYVKRHWLKRGTDSLSNAKGYTKLDEVLVNAKVEKRESGKRSLYGVQPDATIYVEDYEAEPSVIGMLNRVVGVFVITDPIPRVSIRGSKYPPLFIVDGMPIQAPLRTDSPFEPNLPQYIMDLNPAEVERIEILKGTRAAIYGQQGMYGVVLIYTKRAGIQQRKTIFSGINIMGHSVAKEFYSPKYDVSLEAHKKLDKRTTLYWNPTITTDKNGNATITFFNSDEASTLQVDIQALSKYGIPGAYLETIGENTD